MFPFEVWWFSQDGHDVSVLILLVYLHRNRIRPLIFSLHFTFSVPPYSGTALFISIVLYGDVCDMFFPFSI